MRLEEEYGRRQEKQEKGLTGGGKKLDLVSWLAAWDRCAFPPLSHPFRAGADFCFVGTALRHVC